MRLLSLAGRRTALASRLCVQYQFLHRFEHVPAPLVVMTAFIKSRAGLGNSSSTFIVSIQRIMIGFAMATIIGVIIGTLDGSLEDRT